jgi:hypothetical protein
MTDQPAALHPARTTPDPWFIELTDGAICGFLDGATAAVGSERLNYGCGANSSLGLWGDPTPYSPFWTINASDNLTGPFTSAAIERVWDEVEPPQD